MKQPDSSGFFPCPDARRLREQRGGGYSRSSYPDRYDNRSYDNRYDDRGQYARCYDCGTVERIDRVHGEHTASGRWCGAWWHRRWRARQPGRRRQRAHGGHGGRGAIAGGVASNTIEKNNNSAAMYELFVRMDDGRHRG